MTNHEMLALLCLAERSHKLPESEGGHNGPLTLHCFLTALRDNARTLDYPPGFLVSQFGKALPRMVRRGWVRVCGAPCGGDHIELTDSAREQLEVWAREGCIAHTSKRGRRPQYRDCAGPVISQKHESPYSKSGGQA